MPTTTDPACQSGQTYTGPAVPLVQTVRPAERRGPGEGAADADRPETTRADLRASWPAIIWLAALHVGALAAPWTFTWSALALTVVLHWITGGLGVCLGFHRLLTHQSFTTYPWVRNIFALMGALAGEGTPIYWVATHRQHHAHSDQSGDPHSPRDGAWWSHVFWLGWGYQGEAYHRYVNRWAPDMVKERGLRVVAGGFLLWNFVLGGALLLAGWWFGGWPLGISWLVWGMFVRLVFVLHSTWFVNSASHMWGYRNYITSDDSRNLWWVALITYGEGWHNNHHAHPRMAAHGHRWWEFDMTYAVIRLLERVGLAWNVVHHQRRVRKAS